MLRGTIPLRIGVEIVRPHEREDLVEVLVRDLGSNHLAARNAKMNKRRSTFVDRRLFDDLARLVALDFEIDVLFVIDNFEKKWTVGRVDHAQEVR